MRTPRFSALLSLPLVAVLVAGEAHAQAGAAGAGKKPAAGDSKADEASQRFKAGVGFYKDGDFPAALVEFKRAYELVPNYVVLYNLGGTARELKDYASALSAFERYLRDGGKKIDAKRRKEVEGAIDELRHKVGKLKVVINVDGAEVLVDDVAVGASPLADPLVVNAGRRKLAASSSGYTPVQRVVDVASMAETTVTLELAKIEPTPPPPPPDPVPEQPVKKGVPVITWVALGVTGATAVVTAVTGALALSARGSLKSELGTFPGDGAAITDAQGRTRTLAITTDVFGALTIAGAVTTTVLFLTLTPKTPAKAEPAPTVSLGASPTGIVVRGVF